MARNGASADRTAFGPSCQWFGSLASLFGLKNKPHVFFIFTNSYAISVSMIFEWDEKKARVNLKKHGVSFDEAVSIFRDPLSITVADPTHSETEYRFLDIGISDQGRLLVVSYTERASRIRIISSRQALPMERKAYEEGN